MYGIFRSNYFRLRSRIGLTARVVGIVGLYGLRGQLAALVDYGMRSVAKIALGCFGTVAFLGCVAV